MIARRLFPAAWTVACLIALVVAAPTASAPADQAPLTDNVEVTADRMASDSRTDQVIFTGNVEVRRGDLYVKSDRLEVRQDRQSKKLAQMIAIGNVFIRRGEQAATAEHATFFEDDQKAVLTGNPHAWEGSTEIWGEEMVFLLAEGNMIVTGGAQRVRVQLLPSSDEGTKRPATKTKGRGG